jgi:tetratricopeptide (TPR) repeat protein
VVVKETGVARAFDLHCSLLSLPHLLKLRVADLPAADMPYLEVPPADQARWALPLSELPGRRVGLVWSGNPDMGKDKLRSIPLEAWAPVLQVPDVSFVSLQKGAAATALRTLPAARGVVDWMDECSDMLDTAALICGLDLVIAVDTAVAHLAGALGKPVFLLNRHESEWRWLMARDDSPWYPSLRQFRQDDPADWAPALGRVAQALAAWDLAPPLDLVAAEACREEAERRLAAGDPEGAAQACRDALGHHPDHAPAWSSLARVLFARGLQDEAQEALKRALELDPSLGEHGGAGNEAEASAARLRDRANQCCVTGALDEAEALYRQALALAPEDATLHANLGQLLYTRAHGMRENPNFASWQSEAQALLQRAVALDPSLATGWSNLGYWARAEGQAAQALVYLDKALVLVPEDEAVRVQWVHALVDSQGAEAARVRLAPMVAGFQGHALKATWAWVLQQCGAEAQALALYQTILAEAPGDDWTRYLLGNLHLQRLELEPALAALRQAARNPANIKARLSLGHLLLLLGNLREGFALYEHRFDLVTGEYGNSYRLLRHFHSRPRWQGEPLAGQRLLLWAEQGLGDTLMALALLPQLRAQGAGRLIVVVQPTLERLVRLSGLADEVLCLGEDVAPEVYDLHSPLLSLPHMLGVELGALPLAGAAYLQVPEVLVQPWAQRLASLPGRRVGLVWAGNPKLHRDALRSIPLERWAPVLAVPGVSFISLQKGAAAAQLGAGIYPVVDWMASCEDMLDTAALICGLDLVIAVDTAVAHLAAALGKPVFLLNRHESEWRWMLERQDSPWYPTVRQFRQTDPADWGPALGRVAEALAQGEGLWAADLQGAEQIKNQGNACLAQGDLVGAEAAYRAALGLAPDHAASLNNLGRVLRESGRPQEARACLVHALEVKPDLFQAHYNLGCWARLDGERARARQHLDACLRLQPVYEAALLELVCVLADEGRLAEARALLQPRLGPEASADVRALDARLAQALG